MTKKIGWQTLLSWLALALALALMLRADFAHLRWVDRLSSEGSPPPPKDAASATGYAHGLRHFLGTKERGETYRWIAATQELLTAGPYAAPTYLSDNVPTGRPQLLPKLHAFWLAAISWILHAVTGDSIALCAERAALWEPVISHALAFAGAAAFMGRRYGAASAAVAGLFFALFPPVFGQFIPGVLTSRTWALLLGVYALALLVPPVDERKTKTAWGARGAIAASLALWLDPAFGFPVVLISAVAGICGVAGGDSNRPWLRWSLIGAAVSVAAWFIDRSPWNPAAGELRYLHPLYALAWLGIGLALDGGQKWRASERRRKWQVALIAAGLLLVVPLVYVQIKHGYRGWLYPSAAMNRLTSLDETNIFATLFDWLVDVSFVEAALVAAPTVAAVAAIGWAWLRQRPASGASRSFVLVPAAVVAGVLSVAFIQIRWLAIAGLVALPVLWHLAARASAGHRKILLAAASVYLFGLMAWSKTSSPALSRPTEKSAPAATDLQALVHRHFAHWSASHHPAQKTFALAPPELSDSLVFHGGARVLMSTAWESYPGQVAASRILSAPEPTEAEAVLQSREITHLVVPSWDNVLPLLVRAPPTADRDTFYARLQQWVLPRYLRAVPYHLPRMPGFLDQQLAVFKVVPPQDEALSLSRLAEYFVEMGRPEPAMLVAKVLVESFADDPNAAIARALVFAHVKRQADFEKEISRLAADVAAGRSASGWDRRVQRAIALALARRHDLARPEISACVAEASEESLFDLTPLEAHRLGTLARGYGVSFPNPVLAGLASRLGAEYNRNEP